MYIQLFLYYYEILNSYILVKDNKINQPPTIDDKDINCKLAHTCHKFGNCGP